MNRMFMKVIGKGIEAGFDEVEIYSRRSESLDISVFESRVEKFSRNKVKGTAVRGIKNGRTGFAYTEKGDIKSMYAAVEKAYENMTHIDSHDECRILGPDGTYKQITLSNDSFSGTGIDEKIRLLLEIEKRVYQKCDKVHKISSLNYHESRNIEEMVNSAGLDLSETRDMGYLYIDVVIKDNDRFRSGSAHTYGRGFDVFDPEDIAGRVLDDGLSKIGAKSVMTGTYDVIFRNTAFADLLSSFSGIFSADRVQKGTSRLKGMAGKEIAAEELTIKDDPLMESGMAAACFDGEGRRTKTKNVIEKGVLNTYLHNIKTANKDGVESTGNAGRGSYKTGIGIKAYNFYVCPGKPSLEDGIKNMDSGIIVTELQGLHAGVDPVSCDFSLSAQGFFVSGGEVAYPVCDITVSGNFLDILKNLEAVYNDLKFSPPYGAHFGSPSVRAGKISVAGDKGSS